MSNIIPFGPIGLGAALGIPESYKLVQEGLGIPPVDWTAPKAFTFKRRKYDGLWGWQIGIWVGRLWMNLHGHPGVPFPRTRAEARTWAMEFAKKHGFEPMEAVRKKEPAPLYLAK